MNELVVDAKIENLERVITFVEETLEKASCPMKTVIAIDVAVEEIFANIANYAYAPETGTAKVSLEICGEPPGVTITFSDGGVPYNPLEREDPDVSLSAEAREIGGLGVYMVKKSMDAVYYEYKDGQNVFTIEKSF